MCQNKICLIYQYFLFRADRYQAEKIISLDRLRRSKDIDPKDFLEIYEAILRAEFFEEIADDIFKLLKF